jgi:predicted enzyme related to lactoylglutathione lyase
MLELVHITFACSDPGRVAEFWSALLDYEATPAGDGWLAKDPRGEGTNLLFNRMEKSPTIQMPIHLDINVPDREAERERVLRLGGTLVEKKSFEIGELSGGCTVMRDPEGNGFCLEDGPEDAHNHIWNVSFSCADARELGRFWAFALGWPDENIDPALIRRFRDAGVREPELSGFHVTKPANGIPPRFYFQRRAKSWPESHPVHVDLGTDDRETEVERLTQLGASVVETKQGANLTFTVMRDPEGNPFCVG